MARRRTELDQVRAITQTLQTVSESGTGQQSALDRVLPSLRQLLGADVSCAYCVSVDGQRGHADFVYADGISGDFAGPTQAFFAKAPIPWGSFDPSRPAPAQRNRVLLQSELGLDPERPPPVVRELFPRFGLHDKDQLRVLLCEDSSLLAWVGAFRAGPFTASDRALFETLVQPLRTRLALERRLRQSDLRQTALSAALEHLGAPAFILGPRAQVLEANAAGRRQLEREADLRETLRQAVAGGASDFTLTRMEVAGAGPHHLAIQRLPEATAQGRAAAAAERWKLTPRQGQVLALLSEGMSNRAIAARLSCSESTEEIHVSTIFAKADVESRASLVAKVWSLR